MPSPFPQDFSWGAAATAYQIRGAWNEFSYRPDKTYLGHNGEVIRSHGANI